MKKAFFQISPLTLHEHSWRSLLLIFLPLLLILLGLCLYFAVGRASSIDSTRPVLNLLQNQDWADFAGAAAQSNGVYIHPLGRAIVSLDNPKLSTPNPPVNVRGPHLRVSGDFNVQFTMSDIPAGQAASFYIYGAVPIIYDEWRYQTPQLRLDVSRTGVSVFLWDGSADNPVARKTWPATFGPQVTLTIVHSGRQLIVQSDGKKIGDLADHKLFSQGNVWFGADAATGSPGWLLSSLSAQATHGNVQLVSSTALKVERSAQGTLRSLAAANPRHIPVGAAVASYALFSDTDYQKLVGSQFSMLTPENELKPQFVHPEPNTYSFTDADSLVAFAQANGMAVHGHTLVFSEANPLWMQNAPLNDRQKIMQDHITTVVKHFGGKIGEWDVVNEPMSDNDSDYANGGSGLRSNIWSAAMGESYIGIALRTARTANPAAKLYINEYGLEADGPRWDAFLALIERLQSQGVPIDGVGFQAHIYEQGDEVDPAVLSSHMQTLAALGLASRISEIDVYGDNSQLQADQYAAVLQACLLSPGCTSFTTWGVTDRYGSTTDADNYPLSLGNDLIWDANLQPKPAYYSLKNTLQAH